jgi:zinc protease
MSCLIRHRFLKFCINILCLIALVGGVLSCIEKIRSFRRLDLQDINENTFLKEKTFDKAVQTLTTDGGLDFWLMEDHEVPLVSIAFLFDRAGAFYDPEDKRGLSSLAADLLPLRTEKYDRFQMNLISDLNGIRISFSNQSHYLSGQMSVPAASLPQAVELLSLIFNQPFVDENDLQLSKTQALESLKIQNERPDNRLARKAKEEIYGTHPYARDPLGTAEGIANITKEDVLKYVQTALVKDRLMIGVAGDVTPQKARRTLDEIFAALPQSNQVVSIDAPKLDLDADKKTHFEEDTAQIGVFFASKGTTRLADDFYPLYVANHIFGGSGLTSRLSIETREKRGLTYGVYTWLSTDKKAPMLFGNVSTSSENYPKVVRLMRQEWSKFAQNGATEEEFEAARNYLLASYNLRFNSTAGLAQMLVLMQKEQLGADFLTQRNDFIRRLTLDEVNAAAKKYFSRLPREISLGKLEHNRE